MTDQYNGFPKHIADNLPASVNIHASTNTAPIVITSTGAHGLAEGDYVIIRNHLVDTAANGIWEVNVLSPTTFQLVGSTGNGVGVATGNIQSLACGPTGAEPEDGDTRDAASVDAFLEMLADRTAFLHYLQGWFLRIFAGGSFTVQSGATADFYGDVAIKNNATFTQDASSINTRNGPLNISGAGATTAWRRSITTNSDSNYDVSYDRYHVPVITADRVYTLKHSTGPTIVAGARMVFNRNSLADSGSYSHTVVFEREDASSVGALNSGGAGWIEFEYYDNGGGLKWHAIRWGGSATNVESA